MVAAPRQAPAGSPAPRASELDEVTLRLAQRGDARAQRRFIERYQRTVFHLLSRLLSPAGRDALIDDLAQETMLRALGALPRFDPGGRAKLSTWVLTIATRLALQAVRRRDATALEDPDARPSTAADPEQHVQAETLRDRAARALSGLAPQVQAAFVLSAAHGLKPAEIADVLEIPAETARTRIFRARRALRAALEEQT